MRLTLRSASFVIILVGLAFAGARLRAQDSQILLPDQSAAKAKQLLQEAIQALGGDVYLNLRDYSCYGKASQFGHAGDVTGYEKYFDFWKAPDKERTEFSSKRNIIQVFDGDHGWEMDRGGVTDAPEDSIAQRQDDLKKDLDNILRSRIKEQGMIFRYAGPDVVDLKESDWVELVDKEGRTIRIALERATHLPIRKVVITRNPTTRLRVEEKDYYSNYHAIEGLQTPFQVASDKNGLKMSQVFLDGCQYNTGLQDSFFTKASLEERFAKVGKKAKRKK